MISHQLRRSYPPRNTIGRLILTTVVLAMGISLPVSSHALAQILPHTGMFIYDEQGTIRELVMSHGGPSSNPNDIPVVSPMAASDIFAWVPDLNLSLTNLVAQAGGTINYTSSPIMQGNALLLKPSQTLRDDTYCFVEGNPSLPAATLRYWCFRVSSQGSSSPQTGAQPLPFPPGSVLPSPGVYLYTNNTISLITPVELDQGQPGNWLNIITGYPTINDNQPSILVWSPDIAVNNLIFYHVLGGIGATITFSTVSNNGPLVVSYVSSGGPAMQAGIQVGDTILAVNNTPLTPSNAQSLVYGEVDSTVTVTVLHGTEEENLELTLKPIGVANSGETLPFSFSRFDSKTIQLKSAKTLSPGLYCYSQVNEPAQITPEKSWCFEFGASQAVLTPLPPTPAIDPSAFDMSTAAKYYATNDIIEISVPKGWGMYENPNKDYSFIYGSITDPYALIEIHIDDAQTLYHDMFGITAAVQTPQAALDAWLKKVRTGAKYSEINNIKIGNMDGLGVTYTGETEPGYPIWDGEERLASLPDNRIILLRTLYVQAISDRAKPVLLKMADSLVVNPQNIPTVIPTVATTALIATAQSSSGI